MSVGSTSPVQLQPLEGRMLLSTFSVTNTSDSGAGSLRQAILDANASNGADQIDFNIGSADKRILPTSPLPAITESLTIDATTQPGYSNRPLIELSGGSAGAGANGLVVDAGSANILGLAINGFSGAGILLNSGSTGNVIRRNYIGTDTSGTQNRGNARSGVEIAGSSDNWIGGTSGSPGNIIAFNGSGGGSAGVLIHSGGTANRVLGNSIFSNTGIGIDIARTGTTADGINPADLQDPDTGTNNLQNQAFITSATLTATKLTIVGSLWAAPNTQYHFEFYGIPGTQTGTNQANTLVGSVKLTSNAEGNLDINWQGPRRAYSRYTIIATNVATGDTAEISLAAASTAGSVTGTVFNDLNGDGTRDANEPGLAGYTVFADVNLNGVQDANEISAVSNRNGRYTLSSVRGGVQRITIVVPQGLRVSRPGTGYHSLDLPTATASAPHFGITDTVVIRGFVFNDVNGNGSRDSAEDGLEGWTVYVDLNNNGVLDSDELSNVTRDEGDFRLAGLPAGKYVLRVVPKAGFVQTTPAQGFLKVTVATASTLSNRLFGQQSV